MTTMQRHFAIIIVLFTATVFSTASRIDAAEHVKLVVDYGDGVQKQFTQLPWKEGLTVLGATELAQRHSRPIKGTGF